MGKHRLILSETYPLPQESDYENSEMLKYVNHFKKRHAVQEVLSLTEYKTSGDDAIVKSYNMFKMLSKKDGAEIETEKIVETFLKIILSSEKSLY
jgi:hypothetical protein